MESITQEIARIIQQVRREGDRALVSCTRRFDKVRLPQNRFRLTRLEVNQAQRQVTTSVQQALRTAAQEIRAFAHVEMRYEGRSWTLRRHRKMLTHRVSPIESVGVYIPGGRFAYPSTVLMTAIPAKVAGVQRVVMVSPPRHLTPDVLMAGELAGVDEVYRVGGPWVIAALAYGTRRIAPVDKIVGPGNRYVTEAKRQVFGQVGIDLLAGPSEIVVIADDSTPADDVVTELLAQAEHDPSAQARFLTTSRRLLREVTRSLSPQQTADSPLDGTAWDRSQQIQGKWVPHLQTAMEEVNRLAPEHVALYVQHAERWVSRIRHAGAVFVGKGTPVALGDYTAGPSHVLPTGRAARYAGGLSVAQFLKATHVISYRDQHVHPDLRVAETLASIEGMSAHVASLRRRMAMTQED